MIEKISTPILIAILLYHSYHYYSDWKLNQTIASFEAKLAAQNDAKLTAKPKLEPPKIMKVTENIYMAINFAIANSIMLIGETGIVIVDTTESTYAAKEINKRFREITDKPVKGVIYTHNHIDHVVGTREFLNNTQVDIWAHHSLPSIMHQSTLIVGRAHKVRALHQFGGKLEDNQIHTVGIGQRVQTDSLNDVVNYVRPNKFLFKKEQEIELAGMKLKLIHIPGETDDQIAVYWPEENALMCADNFYKAFPNLYAIRGTPFRSLKLWYDSIDTMRNLNAEYLVPSHTDPIIGKQNVFKHLTDYRDAIQLVHDQTVRFINQGYHPDKIAHMITIPKFIRQSDYLYERYGTVRWSSKSLFSGYMGWFSGDISELEPHTPTEKAERLIKLGGGSNNLLTYSEDALNKNDPQWCLELTSAVLRVDKQNQKAKELKVKSLLEMASKQTSQNGRNYYITAASVILGKVSFNMDAEEKSSIIRNLKLKDLFIAMSTKVKSEECSEIDKVVLFIFPDVSERIKFHLRNGIMDMSGVHLRKEDVTVTVDLSTWREIMTGDRNGLLSVITNSIVVQPSAFDLKELMACFDSNDNYIL
ncbi:linear primary-alkylsulfatase [Hydra vulgaris]|uniref:linear primary-alkylsulfatase n=1 Tax=Hydra vulgaris TaxID=6087 RepID=UPI0002B475EE|nr:putative alkyl/aryl-sulfatase YjcS [Hydra vulgaris]